MERKKIEPYLSLDLLAKQVVEGFIIGLHKSPFHGFSVEFAEHRLYNKGESTRHIDWKLYGRTDKLFVKKFEEETNLRCLLVIDQSSSMYFPLERQSLFDTPNKLSFSAYAAAVLMELLHQQRDAFGLVGFTDKVISRTAIKSGVTHKKHLWSLLSQMLLPVNQAPAPTGTNTSEILHSLAETTHKRSLVVIFSDMLQSGIPQDDLLDALRHLKHCKHEVILFHTMDKTMEVEFDFTNRPYRFIDLESKVELKLNPFQFREEYQKVMHQRIEMLRQSCIQYKIDCIEADVNKGFRQILLPYLLKRTTMIR